jgi:type IV pilus assembly protein PilO
MDFNFNKLSSQFQELDWKDPGTWPAGPKWVMLAVLFLTICALAWYFVLDDKLTELDSAQKQEEKLKIDYTERLKKSVNLQALKDQKVLVTRFVSDLEKQLPDKAEMDKLLSDINYAGVSKGLQFELFKPGTVKIENYYAELPINIKMSGSYHKLAGFAADLSALSRIVTLNNISLTALPATPNMLTMDATAKTFRYLDKEETDTVAKQKQKDGGKK